MKVKSVLSGQGWQKKHVRTTRKGADCSPVDWCRTLNVNVTLNCKGLNTPADIPRIPFLRSDSVPFTLCGVNMLETIRLLQWGFFHFHQRGPQIPNVTVVTGFCSSGWFGLLNLAFLKSFAKVLALDPVQAGIKAASSVSRGIKVLQCFGCQFLSSHHNVPLQKKKNLLCWSDNSKIKKN